MSIAGRTAQLIIGAAICWYGIMLVSEESSDIFNWIPLIIGVGSILSALFPELIDVSTDNGDSGSSSDCGGDGD